MKKCLIVTSFIDQMDQLIDDMDFFDKASFDCTIAADYGRVNCEKLGIRPDILIGDYDSSDRPPADQGAIVLPTHKDMTDTEAALDLAAEKGCRDITLLGGLGGRFDHTMGNLGMLAKFTDLTDHIELVDGENRVFMARPTGNQPDTDPPILVEKGRYTYLGMAAWTPTVTGLTSRGVAYPVTDFTLSSDTTRGACNEILPGQEARITFRTGKLMIIQ